MSLDAFVALLARHGVTAVADVRSVPFSRFTPQFNRDSLEASLRAVDIRYVFLGRELGARSDDPRCYENGRVRYDRLARSDIFRQGIQRVLKGAREHRIALMCAEKEPLDCHRTLLVARALDGVGVVVQHILPDGTLESHRAAMDRLLDVAKVPRQDLFRSREELMKEALSRQEERVAYIDERLAAEAQGKAP
jgi:uncharacterized protein (DUF488 family)